LFTFSGKIIKRVFAIRPDGEIPMHMVVLTKGVPDFREGQVSFDEDGHLERGKTPTVMNPNDRFALQAALQTKVRHGGRVSVMSMGPPGYGEVLQEAMASVYADDLYLISDREMAAADTWATAITLSAAIEKLEDPPDLLFAGFKTADGETGHTGPQTCWCLDAPMVTHVVSMAVDEDEGETGRLRAKRLVEGDVEEIETVATDLPAFVVTDPEFEPSYRTATHRLTLKDPATRRVVRGPPDHVGPRGPEPRSRLHRAGRVADDRLLGRPDSEGPRRAGGDDGRPVRSRGDGGGARRDASAGGKRRPRNGGSGG
jgi:electron transfer flavoprotein beta subunit